MRDSFEDLKRQVAAHHNQMVLEVDQSTEKTVARLAGPRIAPAPVARQIRSRAFEEEKEETTKKTNVFRRALKGLGSKSSSDLARIEDMLVTLLSEVESLKGHGYAYSLSNGETSQAGDHSHIHSHVHSQQSQDSHQSQQSQQSYQSQQSQSQQHLQHIQHDQAQEDTQSQNSQHESQHESHHSEQMHYGIINPNPSRDVFNYDLNTVTEEPASIRESLRDVDSTYYTNDNRPASGMNVDRELTPVPADGMRTPRGKRDIHNSNSPLAASPVISPPQPLPSNDNTPSKGKDKRESYPKISRWSETTTSSGIRSFFGRKKKQGGDPDVSRTNSEFEEDWIQPSDQMTDSPYTPAINRFSSPAREVEKPSLEANRRSLEIKHPQPRSKYNHQLEAAAESQPHLEPSSPTMTQSTTSLNRFIQNGGSYNNISTLAPMVPDQNYTTPTIEYTPARAPAATVEYTPARALAPIIEYTPARASTQNYEDLIPPPTATSEGPSTVISSPEKKKKKHRKHKKDEDRDDPERQARRERRRLQKQRNSTAQSQEQDGGSSSSHPARPQSAGSDRSFQGGDDISVTRKQRQSHMTAGKPMLAPSSLNH